MPNSCWVISTHFTCGKYCCHQKLQLLFLLDSFPFEKLLHESTSIVFPSWSHPRSFCYRLGILMWLHRVPVVRCPQSCVQDWLVASIHYQRYAMLRWTFIDPTEHPVIQPSDRASMANGRTIASIYSTSSAFSIPFLPLALALFLHRTVDSMQTKQTVNRLSSITLAMSCASFYLFCPSGHTTITSAVTFIPPLDVLVSLHAPDVRSHFCFTEL